MPGLSPTSAKVSSVMSRLPSLLREDGGDLGRAQPPGKAPKPPVRRTALRTDDQSTTIELARHAVVGKEFFPVATLPCAIASVAQCEFRFYNAGYCLGVNTGLRSRPNATQLR